VMMQQVARVLLEDKQAVARANARFGLGKAPPAVCLRSGVTAAKLQDLLEAREAFLLFKVNLNVAQGFRTERFFLSVTGGTSPSLSTADGMSMKAMS
jgi:hypothetical protein